MSRQVCWFYRQLRAKLQFFLRLCLEGGAGGAYVVTDPFQTQRREWSC